MNESSSLCEAAVTLASAGWHVFPSKPGTNLPAITEWPDKATTDIDQVRRWWRQWPQANISHVPGKSGVFVVDLDGPDGFASWRQLQRVHGLAPDTATVMSPRENGGAHLYFTAPDFYVKSTAGKLAAGVDVRGTRGQAVLPPSVRPDGAYRWVDPNMAIPPPSRWLVALLKPRPPRRIVQRVAQLQGDPGRRLDGLVRTVAQAPDGQLNNTLHWAACRAGELIAEHGNADTVAQALLDAAVGAGHPRGGAWRTIQSGLSKSGQRVAGEVA